MRYLRRHGDRGSFKRQDEVEDESPHLPFGITTAPPCHELFMSAFMNSYLKAVFGLIRQDEILREFAFSGPGDYLTSSTRMVRARKMPGRYGPGISTLNLRFHFSAGLQARRAQCFEVARPLLQHGLST
jgi:hypothetical protein